MNTETEEKLINLVREHPCLYNKKDDNYKNKKLRDQKWEDIAKSMENEMSGEYILHH